MKSKRHFFSKKTGIVTFLLAVMLFSACKKQSEGSPANKEVQLKFFNLSSITDIDIKNFAIKIQSKNQTENFLENFIANNGHILWNDARKIKTPTGILAILPFAPENKNEINGFVLAKQEGNVTSFGVFNKARLMQYGFDENSKKLNAQKVQAVINDFNHQKFNINTYKLADIRQLPLAIRDEFPDKMDITKLVGKLNFKHSTLKTLGGYYCFGYWEDTDWWYDPDGNDDPCHCSGNEYYAYTTSAYASICTLDSEDGGGFGGSGGESGGSGGGGGGIPTDPPAPFNWTYPGDDGTNFTDPDPSLEPDVQFDPADDYETRYPAFTNVVKNLKTFVKNSPEVMSALQKWSGFTKQQILDKLTYGHGPTIKLEEMEGKYGYYNKTTSSNVLHIRASYVRGLEAAQLPGTKQATAFLLAVSILHEFVHFGVAMNNVNVGAVEFGNAFERTAFKMLVEDNNAGNLSIIFKY